MLKNLILLLTTASLFLSCTGNTTNARLSQSPTKVDKVKPPQIPTALSDSARLVKCLDSLPIAGVPFNTEGKDTGSPKPEAEPMPDTARINLAVFKDKKLLGLPLKLRPRQIGGSLIDDEGSTNTFDLTDSTFKANWLLFARQPQYFVIMVDETFVTLTYHLKVIDAMHVIAADPASNNHYHGSLSTTFYKGLKFKLIYYYDVQTDEQGNFDTEVEEDYWFVDKQGHFRFERTKVI